MRKNIGFGLLELILVLALVGVIVVGVLQLYHRTSSHASVLQATAQVKRLLDASHAWLSSKRQADFSSETSNFMPVLLSGQWVEPADADNAWGGAVQVRGTSSGSLQMMFGDIPENACRLLKRQLSGMREVTNAYCKGSNGRDNFRVEFSA